MLPQAEMVTNASRMLAWARAAGISNCPNPAIRVQGGRPVFRCGTDDHDPLYFRLPTSDATPSTFVDVAAQEWLGDPVLGVETHRDWVPDEFEALATELGFGESQRWVAYAFRDLALECRRSVDGPTVLLDPFRGRDTEHG